MPLSVLVSSVGMPRNGVAGSYGNVWQKPLQYCKVISLQLIKINEKKWRSRKEGSFSFRVYLFKFIFKIGLPIHTLDLSLALAGYST